MALIKSRARSSSASASNAATASAAGCRPAIHSSTAHESRTRVFTRTLFLLVGGEGGHQVVPRGGAREFLPNRILRQNDFLSSHLEGESGTLGQIERGADGFWDCDLAFG